AGVRDEQAAGAAGRGPAQGTAAELPGAALRLAARVRGPARPSGRGASVHPGRAGPGEGLAMTETWPAGAAERRRSPPGPERPVDPPANRDLVNPFIGPSPPLRRAGRRRR